MRYVLLLLAAVVVLGIGGFVWLGWYSGIAPGQPPARTAFAAASVARGEQLAALGDCMTCHTARGGAPFAGGLPLQTPFGTIYATNITPDPATGIGTWTEAALRRALHQGVDRGGHLLYPAFPYDHFTLLSAADDADLYAYLMTRQPVHAVAPPDNLPFPLDFRPVLALWRLLFFRPAAFHPDTGQSAAWNRGAYLVRGIAHCGACHTSRNFLGAENSSRLDGGHAQGWYAYALDAASPAPTPWTEDSLYAYLRHGWQPQHGDAHGPMAEVTHNLARTPDDDVRAIATYVAASIGHSPGNSAPPSATPTAATSSSATSSSVTSPSGPSSAALATGPGQAPPAGPGEALYRATCAACHQDSRGPPFAGIDLSLSSALHAPNPTNLANVVVQGIPATREEQLGPIMPGFGAVFTDRQVANLVTWLRARYGGRHAWDGVPDAVKAARSNAVAIEAAP